MEAACYWYFKYIYLNRNQTLLNENKAIKQQAKILLEKEKHDNELIEALMVRDLLNHLNT